ncbi:hypothetical protein GCM10011489_38660 [Gordonia jinhuaensis]|uniref:Uncharacterized protein n=1 Tax=Gordonia jinhuaensis TaxID=1517702 RepID=A0A916TJ89_9ACTN|nr:hypothetical protein GCM10011489_38660 [Gordonia jinhuaensis]
MVNDPHSMTQPPVLSALVAGASASVVGGLANGLATFAVGEHMASVGVLGVVLIGTAIVVLAVRLLLVPHLGARALLAPLLSLDPPICTCPGDEG